MPQYTLLITCLRSGQQTAFWSKKSAASTWYKAQRSPMPPVLKEAIPTLGIMFNQALARITAGYLDAYVSDESGLRLRLERLRT